MNPSKPQLKTSDGETYLPPIEQPKGLMMKLAYYFTRRRFGMDLLSKQGVER